MDSPHRCSCADDPHAPLDPTPSRRTSRLQHWISEQCHLAVLDLGLELEPLFSAATYVPVAQRPLVPDVALSHKKTASADSVDTTTSSSSSSSKRRASGDALMPRDTHGWYWRTSTDSGSSEEGPLPASYVLPPAPVPPPATPPQDHDFDARSDSPLLGFASDSEDEQEPRQQQLAMLRSSQDFPHTPGPEDMDAAFLVLSPPVTPPTEKERLPRDKLRYPARGYRRQLPSGYEVYDVQEQTQTKKHSPRRRCSVHSEHTREDQVSTPTPHHHSNNFHQQRTGTSPSSSSSPSLIQSSPSLVPASSLSSYPSVTSLSSLHSRPSIASLHSISSEQHRPALSRKPSIAKKPSFPLLKEVKEEEGESLAGPMPPLGDAEEEDEERARARTISATTAEEVLSQTSIDETVIGKSSPDMVDSLLPAAQITTAAATATRAAAMALRMRSNSAGTVPGAVGGGLVVPSGHAYSQSCSSHMGASVGGYSVPVPLISVPTRASVGLGLGPGVGVRTLTRSRSNSSVGDLNGNLLSTYTASVFSSTGAANGLLSVDVDTRTPPGTAVGAMSAAPASPVIGAGTRHAVYIVDSEEVSRRLGELLQNESGNIALDEDDNEGDEESRRRTVMMLEDGEREMADPVLPLGDYFRPARDADVQREAGEERGAFRPSTPPMSSGLNQTSSLVNLTPTRRVPYPNPRASTRGHTPSPSLSSAASVPPPNTPASAGGFWGSSGFGGVYASSYARSSQIYLGPAGRHSRGSSLGSSQGDGGELRKNNYRSSVQSEKTDVESQLLPSAPILTNEDLEKRLGPPPKRPPPAPPLELGVGLGQGFRFPEMGGAKKTVEVEDVGEVENDKVEEEGELCGSGQGNDSVDEMEIEALKREMGLFVREGDEMGMRKDSLERGIDGVVGEDEKIKARDRIKPSLSLVVPGSKNEVVGSRRPRHQREEGGREQSRWSTASSVILKDLDAPAARKGNSIDLNAEGLEMGAMGTAGANVGGLIGTKRWRRRSKEGGGKDPQSNGKEGKNNKAKSAPASPVSTRKELKEEKRKSFARGEVDGQPPVQGGKRSRLVSFFSKLAGSGSGNSSVASSPAPPKSSSTSEPDLRVVSGAWEAMPLEDVPPVPPVPPLHTLPRMASRSSMASLSRAAAAGTPISRRGTMVSQLVWDEEDYGNSVPPTPSSFVTGFGGSGSAMASQRGSVAGGMSLRTSRSVSNLNVGVQKERGERDAVMVRVMSPPSTPVSGGGEVGGDGERTSVSSLPPPPVPPKDFVAHSPGYEWPSVSPLQVASPMSLVPPGGDAALSGANAVRDRMMVRLRLKSSPSLGNLRAPHQPQHHAQPNGGPGRLRSLAARMMGRENGSP